ncbi:hypothetical protein WQQ_19300 [Hydrocarboniphaga effusa AP103]|uniref:Uncharacterized protein n=1 Tax=Hydrocarboniphaga effusa AP103 TaxID=1172194 RepID=I8TDK9_9GAMM|nr:hypothetical protein WQQ_19300 [Hydrocarboniphaga effusa AP103]
MSRQAIHGGRARMLTKLGNVGFFLGRLRSVERRIFRRLTRCDFASEDCGARTTTECFLL